MKKGLLIFISSLGVGASGDTGFTYLDYSKANKIKNILNKELKKSEINIEILLDDDENKNTDYKFYIVTPFVNSKYKTKELNGKPVFQFSKLDYHTKTVDNILFDLKQFYVESVV
ncbi:hypothetical protein [Carnobacterium divergens]|nr:hypothetical protein [Carnobacterium divergens]MDO0876006.1 hypothetical protein [Carnobacterium divergens]SUX23219.1 Uncharacterised protein [Carnobacterium divergens]